MRRSGLVRDDVFLETNFGSATNDAMLDAFDKSAGKLGVERLDLLILHQPLPSRFDLTLDASRVLETLLTDGNVRTIGVSNFMPEHLQRLHAEHGMLTQAWAPIGGIISPGAVATALTNSITEPDVATGIGQFYEQCDSRRLVRSRGGVRDQPARGPGHQRDPLPPDAARDLMPTEGANT